MKRQMMNPAMRWDAAQTLPGRAQRDGLIARAAGLCLALSLTLACGSGTVGPGLAADSGVAAEEPNIALEPRVTPRPSVDAGVRPHVDAMAGGETCDNQLDDDHDGHVDENCSCDPTRAGGQQSCYPGPVATRGVGVCRAGTQRCLGDQEFKVWGACSGSTTPGVELPGDQLDNDCDGEVDESEGQPAPSCGNGAVNYPSCTTSAAGNCVNGTVNPPACTTAPSCGNGAVNYPSCTTNAAGNCVNGNIDPPACTTAPNRAPSAPALNVPSSVEATTAFEARFTATDPDGDTLRYGFDATADGSVDAWYPATGYVGSGSTETRPWRLDAGTFTFQVLAQDSKGMSSAWTQHTITVTPPACPALGAQETRALNASQLVSRVLRGENVKVFPGAAGTSVLVSRGGQAEVASSYSATALYFEGPVAEYGLSSGGNNLSFVDRCGRTTRAAVQGPLTVTFYFADGNFSAEIQSGPTWHLVLGAGHLYLDARTENLSEAQSTVNANLRPGGSQGRF